MISMNNPNLEQRVMQALKQAMKDKDQAALRSLRAIKSAILLAKTDGSGKELDAEREIKILQKLVKQRKESLSIYETQQREDLAQTEREEIAVIEAFLPAQLSDDELRIKLQELVSKSGVTGKAAMGKVMGMAMQELAGMADGKRISSMLKDML